MPATEVRAFRDADRGGTVPVQEWLDELEHREPKAYAKCLARILELAEKGNEMRRPHADYLRDGICELRATLGKDQYRLLYFFFGKNIVAVSHGITKEREVPPAEIEVAIKRKNLVVRSPDRYTADFDIWEPS
jgi:phage-related protein